MALEVKGRPSIQKFADIAQISRSKLQVTIRELFEMMEESHE